MPALDIEAILIRPESKTLDFKGPMAWDPNNKTSNSGKKNCCGLVKDILAMANTEGGLLVIGVAEETTGFKAIGISEGDLGTWDSTKLNQFVTKYSSSPINCTTQKVAHQDKHLVVIDVPTFPGNPHLCVQDGTGLRRAALYVRTSNNESAEVSDPTDLDRILERALRNRADDLLKEVRAVISGASQRTEVSDAEMFDIEIRDAIRWFDLKAQGIVHPDLGYLQTLSHTARYTPKRFTDQDLISASQTAEYEYPPHWGIIYFGGRTPSAFENGIEYLSSNADGALSFFALRMYESGFLAHRRLIPETSAPIGGAKAPPIDKHMRMPRLGAYVGIAIDSTIDLYRALGISDEEVTIQLNIIGAYGMDLRVPPDWGGYYGAKKSALHRISVERTFSLEEWVAGEIDHAQEMASELAQPFGLEIGYRRDLIETVLEAKRKRTDSSYIMF